jgi:hypothetical protein
MSTALTLATSLRTRALLNRWYLLALAAILGIYAVLATLSIERPGLYMDSVNPDYDVVHILDPAAPVSEWLMPGNLLFGRFPVLAGPYTGSFLLYWTLPFYVILGHGILSLRVSHIAVGAAILLGTALISRKFVGPTLLSLLPSLLLAMDPAFLYVFRTQATVLVMPALFIIAAIWLLGGTPDQRKVFAGGLMLGLAGVGYFVFAFTWPGFIAYVLTRNLAFSRMRAALLLLAGVAIGMLPYVFGYALLFATLGPAGGAGWIRAFLASASLGDTTSYPAKVIAVGHEVWLVLTGEWQWLTFWGLPHLSFDQSFRATVLIVAAGFTGFLAFRSPRLRAIALLVLVPPASFLLIATLFGARLGGHEYVTLVPFGYICLIPITLALSRTLALRPKTIVSLGVVVLFTALDLTSAFAIESKLQTDGGEGLYSSLISQLPLLVEDDKPVVPYIFWSWGELFPFIYETGGSVPAYDPGQLKFAACRYGKANLVLLGNDALREDNDPDFMVPGVEGVSDRLLHDPESHFTIKIVSMRPLKGACDPSYVAVLPSTKTMVAKVTFQAAPNPVDTTNLSGAPTTTITWHIPGATRVAIHVDAANGTLWTYGPSIGSAETGPWIHNGLRLYLQDISRGEPGRTAAVLTIATCTGCSK